MLVAALVALAAAASPAPFDPAAPPEALAPAVKRADDAAAALQQRLRARLGKAMADGGPATAVSACRDDAPGIAAEVASAGGVRIGRTSDRLRNAANAAPAWAAAAVAAAAGKPAAAVKPLALDLGDRIGVLKPIALAGACTRCHGKPDAVPAEVAARLQAAYPHDQATGYEAGEHRGFLWVEVPK